MSYLCHRQPLRLVVIATLVIALSGCAASTPLQQAASEPQRSGYWVKQGALWHGVKVAGEAPRSLDRICQASRCFAIQNITWPLSQLMQAYGLENLDFEQLQPVAVTQEKDGWIQLPEDLGRQIYRRAWYQYQQQRRRDSLDLWP